jgi:hypothetical protein
MLSAKSDRRGWGARLISLSLSLSLSPSTLDHQSRLTTFHARRIRPAESNPHLDGHRWPDCAGRPSALPNRIRTVASSNSGHSLAVRWFEGCWGWQDSKSAQLPHILVLDFTRDSCSGIRRTCARFAMEYAYLLATASLVLPMSSRHD